MNAHQAAEKMLQTGLFYNPIMLAREFGESAQQGARCLKNICASDRYQTTVETYPVKKVKVTAIDGRRISIDHLQNTALLFKRPSLLGGGQAHGHR